VDGGVPGRHLGKIYAKTTKWTWWRCPRRRPRTPHDIDDQDRITVTDYRGNKVAVFDTRSEKFTNTTCRRARTRTARIFDKNGEIWASTMHTDRVVRLDPKTGNAVQ